MTTSTKPAPYIVQFYAQRPSGRYSPVAHAEWLYAHSALEAERMAVAKLPPKMRADLPFMRSRMIKHMPKPTR